ncbi:ssDNA endonuclease and repair protein rad10 [Yamadazyma tenuis]|nr:ssDNA endonuclease and repair protein rad10 [Yamadazyma tenuis]
MYSQIQVAPSQKGNPVFQSSLLKQKPIAYNKEILSDYYINPTLQVLFLSMKYHQLHPEYIWRRCKKLNQGSTVSTIKDNACKILLAVIDIESPQEALRKLNNICIKQDLTLLIAWSFEQAGNYIAMLKDNELSRTKVNLTIRGAKQSDFKSNLTDTLTSIRAINKTDVINLMTEIGSFKDIVEADNIKIHGFGDRKISNLKATFSQPFILNKEQTPDNEPERSQ